uniref:Rqc2 homolog RqcH n=1 Tax=Ammonifex degensii TaxID=42838 RepID=A0A7C2HZQ7_9THEO
MPFDGLVLHSVTRELQTLLTGGRIERVYQPGALEVILVIRKNREKYRLLLSAAADAARVHITEADRRNPEKTPFFCSTLRRHLEGGRITAVTQPGLERILHLTVTGTDEVGRPVTYLLVAEIMGKHSNIILVAAEENKIIDAAKRYTHAVSRYREVLPGQPYIPPPPPGKADPLRVTEEEFFAALSTQGPETGVAQAIQRLYQGLGLFSAREVVCRAELPPDLTVGECGLYEYRRLYASLTELVFSVANGTATPALVFQNGTPVEFAPFDPRQSAGNRTHGPMNEVLDRFHQARTRAAAFTAQRRRLEQWVGREINRLHRKSESVAAVLNDPDPERYRLYGELLTANLYRLKPGEKEAILENFYLPDAPRVSIPLDPALTPAQNAQLYFKKHAKARAARQHAAREKERLDEELAYLATVATAIEQATGLEDLQEVAVELAEQGYLGTSRTSTKKEQKDRPQPLKIMATGGLTIFVGKNNRQNDYVTFRLAGPDDVWLHARGVPGAHVILKTGTQEPSPAALAEAGALAAYFSQARHAGSVPVDWTRRANVQRPKGARPGFVTYTGEKTLYADPAAAAALLRQRYGSATLSCTLED